MTAAAYLGSTYRMQLHGMGFAGARRQVAYLSELGVETLYLSPVLVAVPGSTHGYDVVDPSHLDPALGTAEEFASLLAELERHGMRLLVDIVPNHMAAHPSNPWWWDVLRSGQGSAYAAAFDIDWTRHGGRVLVPTLPEPLAALTGTVDVVPDPGRGGELVVTIGGQAFPCAPETPTPGTPTPGTPDPWAVLGHQHYRPSDWRLSRHEGNYRRFFDIDGLVGVRVEDPAVFAHTHDFLSTLAGDDRIAGWRVDHIDGLTDPAAYLERLRRQLGGGAGRKAPPAVLVEKILAADETLPPGWAVDGTTGYEFATVAGSLFVDPAGRGALAHLGRTLTGETASFADLAYAGKQEVVTHSFPAALAWVGRLAMAALDESSPGHDLAQCDVEEALAALAVHLDVYRTYLDGGPPGPADRRRLSRAAAAAATDPCLSREAGRALSLITGGFLGGHEAWLPVAQRWQQLSGAVMAKGVEDTATYRYAGLLCHAEVGADPDLAGADPAAFGRLVRRPPAQRNCLNATSTHDAKRSEDVRARLYVLSEVSDEWAALVARWHRRYRGASGGPPAHPRSWAPDVHDELVLYQTLAGVWTHGRTSLDGPTRRRVQAYMVKAAREARRHSGWEEPDLSYERALTGFVAQLGRDDRFGQEMGRLVRRIGPAAATNSLSLLVLKSMVPGVPDIYQGNELWTYSLTDPDNRRPVDYGRRRSLLGCLPGPGAGPDELRRAVRTAMSGWDDGSIKFLVTRALLHFRREHPDLFARGSYHELAGRGPLASHVTAFARRRGRAWAVGVVPCRTMSAAGPGRFALGRRVWDGTTVRLPAGAPPELVDACTGATVSARRGVLELSDCLAELPVGVLASLPRD